MGDPILVASTSQMETNEDPISETSATTVIAQDTPTTIVVSADDHNLEVGAPGKQVIQRNEELKIKVIGWIASSIHDIILLFKGDTTNIDHGNQALSHLFTCHTIRRQMAQKTEGNMNAKMEEFDMIVKGDKITFPKDNVMDIVVRHARDHQLEYKYIDPSNKEDNWYGIAGPYLCMLAGYKYRMDELRVGHSKIKVGKRRNSNSNLVVSSSDYGITGAHHIFCEGVLFPPEKKASMVQSMGPATQLIMYINAEKRYKNKWKVALLKTFAHFPRIAEVLTWMEGKDSNQIRPVIGRMLDLAILTTLRSNSRAYLPPTIFSFVLREENWSNGGVTYKGSDLIKNFNFSGRGLYTVYRIAQGLKWKMDGNFTPEQCKQAIFHATFGTYSEDFGILSQISTTKRWYTREEFGESFRNPRTSKKTVETTLVHLTYYSKLASANLTREMASQNVQCASRPVFSGNRKRKFSVAFFEYLKENTSKVYTGIGIEAILNLYTEEIQRIRSNIEANGMTQSCGTVKWRRLADLNSRFEDTEELDLVFEETGDFFLSRA
uniref:Nucleocapsid protein n=1 Tax=Hubei earwig virus 1 TaxID=1922890 RepID=A0A1L3KKK4_9VIRU|nr:nucleocapsid protein [Hubei earwig virus 1]